MAATAIGASLYTPRRSDPTSISFQSMQLRMRSRIAITAAQEAVNRSQRIIQRIRDRHVRVRAMLVSEG